MERELIVVACLVEIHVGWLDAGCLDQIYFLVLEKGMELVCHFVETRGFDLARSIFQSDVKNFTCKFQGDNLALLSPTILCILTFIRKETTVFKPCLEDIKIW